MWKDIKNWEEIYQVNELGQVRNIKTGNLIHGDTNNAGYPRVGLYDNDRHQKLFRHRLVAEAFIPNPLNLKEINHKNGNKSDNTVENLEWITRTENEHHAHRNGLKPYTPFLVRWADGSVEKFEFTSQLSERLNLTAGAVKHWLKKRTRGYMNYGIRAIEYI